MSLDSTHSLVGTWINDEEDSDAAFVVSIKDGKFCVSGFCRSDGEPFRIRNVYWDGAALRFEAQMQSTGTKTINCFRLRPDGRVDLELTTHEVWKKKDVKPGEIPAAWSNHENRTKP